MAFGVEQGLAMLAALSGEMADYYPYHAARADLLRRAGQREASALAYQAALTFCDNRLERAYFERRLAEVTQV
jgi:RNA polymerase sigma-70 factor (ECF subfamily)